jgi:hypothetical protein
MPWKFNEENQIEVRDGNPIWVNEDGAEGVVQGNVISRLNTENKQHRERAEKAETALKNYEGLDPAVARDALDKMSKIDGKALIDAGQVDQLKSQFEKQFAEAMAKSNEALGATKSRLENLIRENAFSGSRFVAEELAIPRSAAEAVFGRYFKVENDTLVAVDKAGNPIASKKNFGANADLDEALQIILENHPERDQYLRAASNGGSGAPSNAGRLPSNQRVSRADFDKMAPSQQKAVVAKVSAGEAQLVD